MTWLSKFLPALLMPLNLGLLLVVGGQIRRRRSWVWAGVAIMWLASTPMTAALLARFTEGSGGRLPAGAVAEADAIVVLSSGRSIPPGPTGISEWEDGDRFFGGVELFQAGKAPLLIFTAARPYRQPTGITEGETLAGHARAMGVPGDRILTTGPVSNTADEAREVAAVLPARPARVLLVTSAYHIPRARRLFEHAGFTVEPFPVDFQRRTLGRLDVTDILPSGRALHQSETMIHEIYGRAFYWLRGY
jgi:uncharacterized SAM-binding protein YcdF (DUF218 family)